jgi:RimJ/RimL family protein N-acetyltransferase
MRAPPITGDRVELRALVRADAARVVAILNEPEVRRTLRPMPVFSVGAEEAFIESLPDAPHDLVLAVAARGDGRLVGVIGLHHLDDPARKAELGIFIGPPAEWGRGFAGEAIALLVRHGFDALGLNRIWLHVHADHAGAIRLYERLGFRREGLLRQSGRRGEGYVDVVVMGLLREEWAAGAAPR